MTDPKDCKLSPIGRKWDNTLERSNKWSLERAALYGAAFAVAQILISMVMIVQTTGISSIDPVYVAGNLIVRAIFLSIIFVVVAAIRNQFVRS
jgi:hypothetical protein